MGLDDGDEDSVLDVVGVDVGYDVVGNDVFDVGGGLEVVRMDEMILLLLRDS